MEAVGRIAGIFRYPVKSMAGETLPSAVVGWHGLEGDRRLAFVRSGVQNGFPFLSASGLPALITYVPIRPAGADINALPTRVRTPRGAELELRGEELRAEIAAAHGAPVELMELRNGIFDDASLSLIARTTIDAIGEKAGVTLDVRRFRPNFFIETAAASPFAEEAWIGRTIRVGEKKDGPAIAICTHDIRCVMINFDPSSAESDARILKAAVELNDNRAGVYATVVRTGVATTGDRLYLE